MRAVESVTRFITSVSEKGFFHLLSVNFFVQFLGFGTSLLVTKFLTPEDFGKIKILQSYAALFLVLAGFGFNSAVLKYCSEDRPEDERQGILRFSLIRASLTTVFSLTTLAILSLAGIITSSPGLSKWLLIYSLVIPFGVMTEILITYLQSIKKIKQMARAQGVIKVQSFILIVLSTWKFGISGFIYATIAAYLLGLLPLLRQVGLEFSVSGIKAAPVGFLSIALFSLLANGTGILRQYGDLYILDHFTQNRIEIGFYSLATTFFFAASQVTGTVQAISTPYFCERADDQAWFRNRLINTQLKTTLLSIGVSGGIYVLCYLLVNYVYGPSYHSTLLYLAILLLKYILWSSCAIVGVAIFALGFVNYNLLSSAITTISSLILSYWFLGKLGIPGVAWAQVVSGLIQLAISNLMLRVAYKVKYGSLSP